MKNKHGDIPIMILVIGVVALCGLVIASFFISDINIKAKPFGVGLVEEVNSNVEKFYFYLNLGDSNEVAAEKIGAKIEDDLLVVKKSNNFISINYRLLLPQ